MYITRMLDGWYNFESLPQETRYIKVFHLRCGTDRKAINQARKIVGNKEETIEVKSMIDTGYTQ